MFSVLKKLTRSNDDRCPAPVPMSSSLQKKFSRGVHFNMKILIKGDRNVGKSCLLQRLQGGPFIEEYVPTDQIQVAPIHWTYKNTDHIVKVEVWEVVDKGRTKKKPPLGLKLDNQSTTSTQDGYETPVLDATFLDVYKNTSGVILMLDITKPWTFEYVVKELSHVPADLPVVLLGNHCDMQHHRQVHPHHIEPALHHAKLTRSAPIRYAESSMRNGFGLRLLYKFLSVPFLRLQRTSLLEQMQRNQKDMEEIEKELDDFQNSGESHYNLFLDSLLNKRRQNIGQSDLQCPNNNRSPSIVLGAGKPIIPTNVNPLLAQSINSMGIKAQHSIEKVQDKQSYYVSPNLLEAKPPVGADISSRLSYQDGSALSSSSGVNTMTSSGALEEFYAGALDSSFLEDLTPLSNTNQDVNYESDSDDDNIANPKVTIDQVDIDVDHNLSVESTPGTKFATEVALRSSKEEECLKNKFMSQVSIDNNSAKTENDNLCTISMSDRGHHIHFSLDNDFPLWAGDSSARRSPEGGEDPDNTKERDEKKKHKKKKSKDTSNYNEKSESKGKKKHKKLKSEKHSTNPQQDLLVPVPASDFSNYYDDEYDSI